MKYWLLLSLLVVGLVPAAVAEDPPPRPKAVERALHVERNYALIQVLVRSGLQLAAEEDPLKRAGQCLGVADRLAEEIRQAAEKGEEQRVAELGEHLHALFVQGVAPSVRLARRQIPPESTAEGDLRETCNRAAAFVQRLEEFLQSADPDDKVDKQPMIRELHGAVDAVERAFKPQSQRVP
jgi:hypothetical protein